MLISGSFISIQGKLIGTIIMRIVIAGGKGFIGRHTVEYFQKKGHKVHVLSRSEKNAFTHLESVYNHPWDAKTVTSWKNIINGSDVVINLVGESLLGVRWTTGKKNKIYSSRINSTRAIVNSILSCDTPPKCLINASGVGIYKPSFSSIPLDETSPYASDFLAKVCQDWEAETFPLNETTCRAITLRTGIVLGNGGGMLQLLSLAFKLGGGIQLGNGDQWMSWVHMSDMVSIMDYIIHHEELKGALNCAAPFSVTSKEFSTALGRVLNRRVWLKMSDSLIKVVQGEMGESLLASINATPKKLLDNGYTFESPNLMDALYKCFPNR